MSFRDLDGGFRHAVHPRNRTLPAARAMPSDEDEPSQRSGPTTARSLRSTRLRRPIVLHGRVQRGGLDNDEEEESCLSSRSFGTGQSVRKEMERRSTYAQLLHETNQYQKTVAELEQILPEAGENPEAAWRAKILMRSAQAVDQELWGKLYDYEKTLFNREQDPEVLQQQTACMKLHRDFKRSHKFLVMAVSLYEKTQRAEMARLGAVGWSGRQEEDEDFYTRTLRERQEEIERMNKSMHQVGSLYQDLEFLIQKQQDPIDELENTVEEAHIYTKSAPTISMWESLFCMANQEQICQSEQEFTLRDGKFKVDGEEVVFDMPDCNAIAMGAVKEALPHAAIRRSAKAPRSSGKTTGSEASILTESSEGSPRGVVESSVAFSDDMAESTDDLGCPDKGHRVAEEFHWMMPFETIASDIQAVQSDIVHFGKELTSEVIAQTKVVTQAPAKR